MIQINWDTFNNANCDSFKAYRSITGITVAFANSLVIGDKLVFSATSRDVQTITFSAVDITSVASQFNAAAKGATAVVNDAGNAVLIRTTAANGKFTLYSCTFATHTSQTPRVVVPRLEWALIYSASRITDTYSYQYTDMDGQVLDSYRVSSVLASVETFPTDTRCPLLGSASLCVVEGRLTNSQNRPLVGAKVWAKYSVPEGHLEMSGPNDGIMQGFDGGLIQAVTDSYGRFAITLERCKTYTLQIPDVSYFEHAIIPNTASTNFLQLKSTTGDQFSPTGDPS